MDYPLIYFFSASSLQQPYTYSLSLSLQGSTLCRVYENPALPEAVALQNRCTLDVLRCITISYISISILTYLKLPVYMGSSLIPPNCSSKNYNQSLLSLTTMSSMYVYYLCTVYLFSYYLYTRSKISFINIQSNRYIDIVSVVASQPWWYLACKIATCNKRTKPQVDAYKCSNLKCSGTDAGPR